MSRQSNDSLREELKDAIAKVRHQIELQAISDHYMGSARIVAEEIAGLKAELAQLEDALANLPPS